MPATGDAPASARARLVFAIFVIAAGVSIALSQKGRGVAVVAGPWTLNLGPRTN